LLVAPGLGTQPAGPLHVRPTGASGGTGAAGISFADVNSGFTGGYDAASNARIILHTTDGGAHWSHEAVPSGVQTLGAVSASTPTHAWAVAIRTGGVPSIISTADGSIWSTVSLPASPALSSLPSLSMAPGSKVGWAVGADVNDSPVILTTTDGSTWTSQTVPTGVISLGAVTAVSPTKAFAVGGTLVGPSILVNNNGVWTTEAAPAEASALSAISAAGPTRVWAVGITSNDQPVIAATTDGITWDTQAVPSGTTSISTVAAAPGTTVAYALGSAATGSLILKTTDGSTWTSNAAPAGDYLTAAAAVGFDHAWLTGISTCVDPSIRATTDGGGTWVEQLPLPYHLFSLLSVSFVPGTSVGWAVGMDTCNRGVILGTTDGSTWNTQLAVDGLFSRVSAADATHAWAVGRTPAVAGSVYATADGIHWTQQFSSPLDANGVSAVNASHVWLAGGGCGTSSCSETITASSDGGSTWQSQLAAGPTTLVQVSMAGLTSGFAVGEGRCNNSDCGAVYGTTNGTGWTPQTLPADAGVMDSVHAASPSVAWVVGRNSAGTAAAIVHTGDGGATWTSQTPPDGLYGFDDVTSSGTGNAWVAGGYQSGAGSIAASTTSGAAWTVQAVPPNTGTLLGITAASASSLWAVGSHADDSGAIILHSADGGATWAEQAFTYPPPSPPPAGTGSVYSPLPSPKRLLDTRDNGAQVPGGGTVTITVAGGSTGVPADATAVVLNVTSVNNAAAGYFQVYPADGSTHSSAVNTYYPNQLTSTMVTVPVDNSDQVEVLTSARADVVVDESGFYAPEAAGSSAGRYNAISPTRITDTRAGSGQPNAGKSLQGGGTPLRIQVTGVNGLPSSGISAAVVNLTVTNGDRPGFIQAYSGARPTNPQTSNVNFNGASTHSSGLACFGGAQPVNVGCDIVANRAVVNLDNSGGFMVYANGSTDLVIDVTGWFSDATSTTGQFFTPLTTVTRLHDTRNTGDTIADHGAHSLPAAGSGSANLVPAGAKAAVLTVTIDKTSPPTIAGTGFLTLQPNGSGGYGNTSDLDFAAGAIVPAQVYATLAGDGSTLIYNGSSNWIDVIVDVYGYFAP
jgi:hypothetical protein